MRSGRSDALRECRDASHRIPPWHKFIPKDPTTAQVYPTGSHHAQVYPKGSQHGTGVSHKIPPRHSPTRTWLSPVAVPLPGITRCSAVPWEANTGRGEKFKRGGIRKLNSLNPCSCIPLPSLMTQRKMSKGSERGSERQRRSRCPGADWFHRS